MNIEASAKQSFKCLYFTEIFEFLKRNPAVHVIRVEEISQ
jgi:hypothetical protein